MTPRAVVYDDDRSTVRDRARTPTRTFFLSLLSKAVAGKASDVHIKVGQPPGARIRGDMVYFRTEQDHPRGHRRRRALRRHATREVLARLDELKEYDTSYSAPGIGRFRVNVYRQRGSLAVVMRFIPTEIPADGLARAADAGHPGARRAPERHGARRRRRGQRQEHVDRQHDRAT